MITIAIVDDEKIIREQIEGLIKERTKDCLIDGFASGDELLSAGKQYDIVFLDIQMRGKNGIDTARLLREKSGHTVLIFVSGTKDYVFQAFDVSAFHYLLKPLEPEKFEEVLQRAFSEAKRQKGGGAELLLVKTRNRTVPLQKSSILYVESRGKKAEIHTAKESFEMYASLSGLAAELGGNFYRCHRGFLVNLAYVSEYYHDSIRLTDGASIYLAKEKYPEFVKTYMRYLKNGGVSNG